jgi:hypothetical protein
MIKKLLSLVLLSMFLAYYASITLFSHSHIINGVTIVHSHPYSKGTDSKPFNHQHSEKGVALIQFLSHFSSLTVASLLSLGILLTLLYKIAVITRAEDPLIPSINSGLSLRAPPVSSL